MKVNIVGFGVMGRNHFRVFRKFCEVTAVCDIDVRNKEEVEKYSRFYFDFDEMIEKEKPDILVIAVQPQDNSRLLKKALKKNIKYILVEKPLMPLKQLKEANEILELADKKEAIVMIGEITCYDPATIALKKNVETLGDIKAINAIRLGKYPFRFTHVGVNEDLLIHDVFFARYILDWQNLSIKNYIKASLFRTSQTDFIAIDGIFEKGARLISIASWLSEEKIRFAVVLGEKAIAQLNFLDENRYVRILPPEVINEIRYGSIEEFRRIEREKYKYAKELELEKIEPLENEIKHFLKCVEKNEEPLTNLRREIETLEMLKKTAE